MQFVIEFKVPGELAGGRILPSYNALDVDTLPLAVRAAQKAIDEGVAEECVIYYPVRVVRACRKVDILDMSTQRVVPVDAPALAVVDASLGGGSTAAPVIGK